MVSRRCVVFWIIRRGHNSASSSSKIAAGFWFWMRRSYVVFEFLVGRVVIVCGVLYYGIP